MKSINQERVENATISRVYGRNGSDINLIRP